MAQAVSSHARARCGIEMSSSGLDMQLLAPITRGNEGSGVCTELGRGRERHG